MKEHLYCGKYETKGGAERYVARQVARTENVHGVDVRGGYIIQPTVIPKAWHHAGPEFRLVYYVYYREQVAA
jgi:hypothetical protein